MWFSDAGKFPVSVSRDLSVRNHTNSGLTCIGRRLDFGSMTGQNTLGLSNSKWISNYLLCANSNREVSEFWIHDGQEHLKFSL